MTLNSEGLQSAVAKAVSPDEGLQRAALEWGRQGFCVLPIRHGSKELPSKRNGGGLSYHNATRQESTIARWWDAERGSYRGCNIGVALKESGLIVLDTDPRNNPAVEAELALRVEQLGMSDSFGAAPCQRTPGGGHHYLFRATFGRGLMYDQEVRGIKERLAGIAGLDIKASGHVVVAPSVIVDPATGQPTGGYVLERGGDLPTLVPTSGPIPPWIEPTGNRGNEEIGTSPEVKLSLAQIENMVAAIPCREQSYEEWLTTGMAIHTQFPGDDGLRVWQAWSKSDPTRYNEGECGRKWASFRPGGSVRIGTLMWRARQNGWRPAEGEFAGDPATEILQRLNDQFAVVILGGKKHILRLQDQQFLQQDAFEAIQPWQVIHRPGWDKPRRADKYWLTQWSGRRTYENGVGLYRIGEEPSGVFNLWGGFRVEPLAGSWLLFEGHLREVICGGNAAYYEFLADWIADLFQDPMNPKGVSVVLRGGEGTGKGTFTEALGAVIGPHHYIQVTHSDHLTGKFNAHLADKILVHNNEAIWGGDRRGAGILKALVTEKHLTLERKGVDPVRMENRVHLISSSNDSWVIPAGLDSRRWFVLDVRNAQAQQADYFEPLYRELYEQGGISAFLHDMLHRKIRSNLARAPVTDALRLQRQQSDPFRLGEFLSHFVQLGRATFRQQSGFWFVTPDGLWDAYVTWYQHGKDVDRWTQRVPSKLQLSRLLRECLNREGLTLVRPTQKVKAEGRAINVIPLADRWQLAQRIYEMTGDDDIKLIADEREQWSS